MKKKIILLIIILVILSISINFKVTHKSESTDTKIEEQINIEDEELEKTESGEIIDKVVEEETETKEESTTNTENNSSKTDSNKSSSSNSESTSKSSSSSSTTDSNTSSDDSTTTSYVGVPDPNSFYYSYHHGNIDFSSLSECESKSYEYLLLDVEDIYGSWCMEVQDSEGTVLGAYLYIKCYSGNCDKYKGY